MKTSESMDVIGSEVKVALRAERSRFERSVKADRRSPEGPRREVAGNDPVQLH
jgi:hypothetical protein